MADDKTRVEEDHNPDAITGEHGSHPVGTGLGAAAAGAATGAAGGAVGGPVGAAIGAVVGGIAGGLAGKAIAEQIDPTVENAYWEQSYKERDYVNKDLEYSTYEPAYRYGWEQRAASEHADFKSAEKDLEAGWNDYRGDADMDWASARPASRDAWDRVTSNHTNKS